MWLRWPARASVGRDNGSRPRGEPSRTPLKSGVRDEGPAKGCEAVSKMGGKPEEMMTWKPEGKRDLKMEKSRLCQFRIKNSSPMRTEKRPWDLVHWRTPITYAKAREVLSLSKRG